MQISFISLFLGLVVGVHPVELAVTGAAASVEVRLDGRSIALMTEPPWKTSADFGPSLAPHILEAVAFDAGGNAVGSCLQWVNMPRPRVEAEIVVERDSEGVPRTARIVWDSLEFGEPKAIEANLDGRKLKKLDPTTFRLPARENGGGHLLTAKVHFPRGIVATAETVVGTGSSEEASSRLTALAMVPAEGGRFPPREEIEGRVAVNGRPLRIVAVEERPADVVIVRDLSIGPMGPQWGRELSKVRSNPSFAPLGKGDRVRFMAPRADETKVRGRMVHLFDLSQPFPASSEGIAYLLVRGVDGIFRELHGEPQSIADAVAVAGIQAVEGNQRRAVVLLIGQAKKDRSTYTPIEVREFLRLLHVPLFVWSIVDDMPEDAGHPWGRTEDVSSLYKLERAVWNLRKALARQRIVWVEGLYLPQEVRVATLACPVAFAGAGDKPK